MVDMRERGAAPMSNMGKIICFEHSSMETYSSRAQKQNQDFVKGYNMASL